MATPNLTRVFCKLAVADPASLSLGEVAAGAGMGFDEFVMAAQPKWGSRATLQAREVTEGDLFKMMCWYTIILLLPGRIGADGKDGSINIVTAPVHFTISERLKRAVVAEGRHLSTCLGNGMKLAEGFLSYSLLRSQDNPGNNGVASGGGQRARVRVEAL